jgi:hypothetical protein
MAVKPSFLRDPDQAAELAALLRDTAGDLDNDLATNRGDMTRRQIAQEETTIRRYRQWANELEPGVDEKDAGPISVSGPVHIRPARDVEGATG